jgi:chemotaxis response regulator CheB
MIYGMPGEAVKLGGASHILPLQRIAVVLAELAKKGNRHG